MEIDKIAENGLSATQNGEAATSTAATATSNPNVSSSLITYGTYALFGFIAGFIFKYFGKAIISTIIISVILLAIFNYLNFITIHCENIKSFFGVTNGCSVASIAKSYLAYVQAHIYESLAVVVGFLLGWTYT